MDLNSLLRSLERVTGLQITLHIYDFNPPWMVDPVFLTHTSSHCHTIKSRHRDACIALDGKGTRNLIEKGAFLKQCHGNLKELVTPLFFGNKLSGVLFLGEQLPGTAIKKEDLENIAQLVKGEIERDLLRQPGSKSAEIVLYLSRNFSRPDLTLSELAGEVGLSESRISQIIRNDYKSSFPVLLLSYRLQNAKNLLLFTDLSVEEIAYHSGFSSGSYFHKVFRKEMELTPGEYRRNGLV